MREFTKTEKEVVRKLIEWCSDNQSIRLGEVLLKLFPKIEYIKPSNKKEDEFYKHTVDISYNIKQGSLSDILEAINLFDLLVKQNYIVVKQLFTTECIGEENQNIDNIHYVKTAIINYYQYDLWEFLCNHFYVTNALVDFAKDFKTPEQRRHNCTTNISVAAIIVSVIIGITSPYISKCISEKSDKESLEQVVSAIKEQKSISIDKFPDIIPDTLNIRVTDASDKQPINLNVTVKENQPIKVQ